MELPVGLPMPQEDWDKTPSSVQAVVILLWQENQSLKQQMLSLQSQVENLQAEVSKLHERVNKNSQNSSKPPSSDPPGKRTYPKPETSEKKKGGQRGHPGKGRKLKSPDQINRVVKCLPLVCKDCGALLMGEDAHPDRHQVCELPVVVPEIVEYQRHTLNCQVCGGKNQAEWPKDMPKGSFGERLQALIGYLSGRFGISHRDMVEMLETLFQVNIGLGSVPVQQEVVSQALKQPVEAAQAYVQEQAVVNLDETGWHETAQDRWLWICSTPHVTVFRVQKNRSSTGAEVMLGKDYAGIVGSDRFSAYSWIEPAHRQVCWAHLKRDFKAFVERGGESQIIGKMLLERLKQFYSFWHRFRRGLITRVEFQMAMRLIRQEVSDLLEIGTLLGHRETRRTCQNILKVKQALWSFVDTEGVEPTNNSAERGLRRGVIWRKRSYGTQSEKGSLFVERILTTVMTLRQQKRNVLDYLAVACKAALLDSPAPSLLPVE